MAASIKSSNKVYTSLVKLTYPYLGPSAARFINRQIVNHLDKAPEDVKASDLKDLVDWLKLSMSILTDNDKAVAEYIGNIKSLIRQ